MTDTFDVRGEDFSPAQTFDDTSIAVAAAPVAPNGFLRLGLAPELIQAVEDLGYDSIWLGEHLLYRWRDRPPRGPWEAWSSLAAIA